MRRKLCLMVMLLSLALLLACRKQAEPYPYRWVYAFGKDLATEQGFAELKAIADTCAAHGLNGIALPGGSGELVTKDQGYRDNLKALGDYCRERGIDLIPAMWSIGYGSGLGLDRNLAEGLPVRDALYLVKGGEARLAPDPAVEVPNGGFEELAGELPAGFLISPKAEGQVFVDREVVQAGKAALRFEPAGEQGDSVVAMLSREVAVQPGRCYVLSGWVRTEGISRRGDIFPLMVRGRDGRRLQFFIPKVDSTADWTRVELGFNSLDNAMVEVAVGAPASGGGRFWVDEVALREVGLVNVLRRPGTPVTVRGEADGIEYAEGEDFAAIADPQLDYRFDHEGPAIAILPGGRIKEGDRLRVSWYHAMTVYYEQVPVCMSEPALYEFWRQNAQLLQETLAPRYYMLNMDEIRMGGTCAACQARGIGMPEMLGQTITKQVELIREVNPAAQVFVWSDMLDPNHNAGPGWEPGSGFMTPDYYFHVNESYQGAWDYIPKDLVIVCWYLKVRDQSLAHFSGLGYRTMAGGYYDVDDLENCKDWLVSLDRTPGAGGIMYCSWSNKFELLDEFGDLASSHPAPQHPGK